MKIPKYIENKLDRRARLAEELMLIDLEISNWIDKNDVLVDTDDYRTGYEMYTNPYASAERIKQAILNK